MFIRIANACVGMDVGHFATGVDYSSCVDLGETGDICMPGCAVGYVVEIPATGFVLNCNTSGDFDAFDATLVCAGLLTHTRARSCG
jgi:hypothetical protein